MDWGSFWIGLLAGVFLWALICYGWAQLWKGFEG